MLAKIRIKIQNMMKKIFIPIIAFSLVLVSLVGWHASTYSASGAPYSDPDKDGPEKGLTACTKTTDNHIFLMRQAWQSNLTTMMDQEKPTSDMVDEAFESQRTYRCWLDYLCEAVMYSANVDPVQTQTENPTSIGTGEQIQRKLTTAEIDQVPGCAKPQDIQIPETQIEYMPACRARSAETDVVVQAAQGNYAKCREMVDRELSVSFIGLKKTLKNNSSQQQIRPLREKFSSIVMKMLAMEMHMAILKGEVESFDSRLPCYAKKCD